MERVNILSTKQLEPLLLGKAAVHGIRIMVKAFIRIHFSDNPAILTALQQLPESASWVLTSPNAVEALDHLRRKHSLKLPLPAHAYLMAGKTTDVFRSKFPGIPIAGTASGATSLAKIIAAQQEKQLVFFCGNLRRQELPNLIKAHQMDLLEIQVYETVSTSSVVTEKIDGIMFFSPSGLNSYLEKNTIPAHVVCFAIGETTAGAIRQVTKNQVRTALQPSQAAMVNLVIEHYRTS